MTRRLAWAAVAIVLLVPAKAPAQASDEPTRWGVTASFIPVWNVPPGWKINITADQVNVDGFELTVGFVRGRDLGGDWGLSLVQKAFRRGSHIVRGEGTPCYGQFGCVTERTTIAARDTSLLGLELHRFFAFSTIKRRLEIGLNVAAGVAEVRGTAEKTRLYPIVTTDPISTAITAVTQGQETTAVSATQLFSFGGDYKYSPLCKLQLGVGAMITRGLKVRMEAGLNLPGYQDASVTVVYFFGGRR
jgi:hypothetical protein